MGSPLKQNGLSHTRRGSVHFATERQLLDGLDGVCKQVKADVAELANTWDEQIAERDKIISSYAIELRNIRRDLNKTQADLDALRSQSLSRRIKRLYQRVTRG